MQHLLSPPLSCAQKYCTTSLRSHPFNSKAVFQIEATKPGMVESACDLSTQEAKEEGQEFKARQGYIASSRLVRIAQGDPEKGKAA